MSKLIKVLRETPFHKVSQILSIKDFKLAYGGWITTSNTTDSELIDYIETEWKLNQKSSFKSGIGCWFQVIDSFNDEPLQCIVEDVYYTKEVNGMYHMWTSPSAYELKQSIGMITIAEMKNRIAKSSFKITILYCTNAVNKQL